MKRIFWCVFLQIALIGGTFGQGGSNFGGGGFFAGYGYQDVGVLSRFVPESISDFSPHHIVAGGMGFGSFNGWVIGGKGYSLDGSRIATDTMVYMASGGVGMFNLGYVWKDGAVLKWVPMLGFGGGGYDLKIFETGNITSTEINSDPGRAISLNSNVLLLDFSLQMFYLLSGNGKGGLTLGLQAGYTLGFPVDYWSYDGGLVTDIESGYLNTPYLTIFIGGTGGW